MKVELLWQKNSVSHHLPMPAGLHKGRMSLGQGSAPSEGDALGAHSPVHPSHIRHTLTPAPGALQELFSLQKVTQWCQTPDFSFSDFHVPVEMFCKAPPGCFVQLLHTKAAHSSAKKGQVNKNQYPHHSIAWKAQSEAIKPKPQFYRSLQGQVEVAGDVIPIKSPFCFLVYALLRLLEQCL